MAIWLNALVACGVPPREELIDSPRVLAMRMELVSSWIPSEHPWALRRATVLPYDQVFLRPYLVGPDGELDPKSWSWLVVICRPDARCSDGIASDFANLPICEVDVPQTPRGIATAAPARLPCRVEAPVGKLPEFTVPWLDRTHPHLDFQLLVFGAPAGAVTASHCAQSYFSPTDPIPEPCVLLSEGFTYGPEVAVHELRARAAAGVDEFPELVFVKVRPDSPYPSRLIETLPAWVETRIADPNAPEQSVSVGPGASLTSQIGREWILSTYALPIRTSGSSAGRRESSLSGKLPADELLRMARVHTTFGSFEVRTTAWGEAAVWRAQHVPGDPSHGSGDIVYLYLLTYDGVTAWQTIPVHLTEAQAK